MLKKFSIYLLIALMAIGNVPMVGAANAQTYELPNNVYEVYPLPQKENYLATEFEITDTVNVVIDEAIDESTKNFLDKILKSKSLKSEISNEVVADKTNIVIGANQTNGEAAEGNALDYFKNITFNENIFNEIDAYILSIDNESQENGTIAILGDTTDAAYYGLATLKMIFNQMPDKNIHSVVYEDYAHTEWRGFIEGFYGFPWTNDARKSLMRFGGQFKMNSYIFGPKDDKYHNSQWRTLYPEKELAEVKELVDVGHESKTQFVWAIHPGFSMVKWDDYDNELQTMTNKLDQLYEVGVRQFALFMDDIALDQSLRDMDLHVKLVTDIAAWAEEKGDVKSLIYCPPYYNQAWTGQAGIPYLEKMKELPESVEVMWTGDDVIGSVNTEDMKWVSDIMGRDPYVWLNWPVNGYKKNRLLLGKVDILHTGTRNVSGIVSNPLEQAELSKVALFGVADFTWNADEFNADQSWLDSFKYIEPEVAEEYNTIAYHMSDPSPNGRGVVAGESENIKAELEEFLEKYTKGESIDKIGQELIKEFDHILHAIDGFRTKGKNQALLEEIEPWLNSLEYVVKADKSVVISAIALETGDLNLAWENLARATSSMSESKKFTRKVIEAEDQIVESGAKRLVPFANEMISKLDSEIYMEIDPEAMVPIAISSYDSVNLNNMIDGDLESFSAIQKKQVNGDWYGVNLGRKVNIKDITIVQGKNDSDHDIFQRGVLEYSNDLETWTEIGEERAGYKITENNVNVEAQYVRYRLTHAGIPGGKPDLWTNIREFIVNKPINKVGVYTNVTDLSDGKVDYDNATISLSNLSNVNLEKEQYVGLRLEEIEQITDVNLAGAPAELDIEVSENGVEWEQITADGPYPNAAYVRIINNTEEIISFDLEKMEVNIHKFVEPEVSHNYGSVHSGKIEGLYNGTMEHRVHFGGAQQAGKFVQIDMGGIIDVTDIRLVVNDGEGDFVREANLEISTDGKSWSPVHSFEHTDVLSANFPEHQAPYRYKTVEIEKQPARYIRLMSTGNTPKWLALNAIIVNKGIAPNSSTNLALDSDLPGSKGNEIEKIVDQKLGTFYTPEKEAAGSLTYKLHNDTAVKQIIALQGPDGISNATVSIRDLNGWHEIGSLAQSLNQLDTSKYDHVLEMKIEWKDSVKPQIHEIITVKKVKDSTEIDVSDLEALIEVARAFTNEEDEYTTESFEALQEAIQGAEESLESIETTEDLAQALELLQNAMDGLVESEEVPEIDVSDLEALIEVARAFTNVEDEYTTESFEALQEAIQVAEESLESIETAEDLAQALELLQKAMDGLVESEEVPGIDVSDLEALIEVARAFTNEEDEYTTESFEALQEAIQGAEESLESIETTEDLAQALELLQKAMDGLVESEEVPGIDVSDLEALIEVARGFTNEEDEYTTESFEALQEAIQVAEESLESIETTEDLAQALELLQKAMDGLVESEEVPVPEIDVSDLEALIEVAKAITNTENNFTTESFEALQEAIQVAEESLESIETTEDLAQALELLQKAMDGLVESEEVPVPKIDVSDLEALIEVAKAITNNENNFTTESFEALQEAIQAAEESLESIETTEDLAQALELLQKAMDGLVESEEVPVPKIDVSDLEALIEVAKAITNNENNFTTESFDTLQEAIKAAMESLASIKTEKDLAQALELLQKAMDGLVENKIVEIEGDNSTEKPSIDKDTNEKLPSTATSIYNLLALGLFIVIIGFSLILISRRRKGL